MPTVQRGSGFLGRGEAKVVHCGGKRQWGKALGVTPGITYDVHRPV